MNKFWRFILGTVIFLSFFSCSIFANGVSPYQISGEMVLDGGSDFENAGFDFKFYNKSEKNIKNFTIVFYLFDENGNPPLAGKNNIVIKIDEFIDGLDYLESTVSIDQYLTYIPQEPYTVDFLYVSQINYEDGSQWNDPFGLGSL